MRSPWSFVPALILGAALSTGCGGKENDVSADDASCPDCRDASVDTCVHVFEDAVCCEGESYVTSATACADRPCLVRHDCFSGNWVENGDDCHFMHCPGEDTGIAPEVASDAGIDTGDACVHVGASTCCEGSESYTPAFACGGTVPCLIWSYCKSGMHHDDADDCFFKDCHDSGFSVDATTDD